MASVLLKVTEWNGDEAGGSHHFGPFDRAEQALTWFAEHGPRMLPRWNEGRLPDQDPAYTAEVVHEPRPLPPVPVELFRHFTPYQPGRRVELVSMADEHTRLRPGTRGTIAFVDDLRTVHIAWDNGSRLAAIVHDGTDVITLLEK